jgi:glutamate 5-kinase
MNKKNDAIVKINDIYKVGDKVRILKTKKLFSKGHKEYYSKTLYKIIGKEGLKFVIQGNGKTKSVLPF